ncbi:MAG: ABC transporter substrate-binding protein [Defluviitaleaceae bacterium]|nr:ABC transporter substrate-binding protein [Defluviitaleaceae bacterium]
MLKIIVLVVLIGMVGCAGASEGGEVRAIRLGFEGGLCQAVIPLAHVNGFFAAEGLITEIIVTGDLVSSRDALAAGHIDAVAGMLAGWLVPVTQGIDIRFTQGLHTGCASAFVLADSHITAFEIGQSVAVSGAIGGAFHNIATRFIHREGLVTDDFTWRDFPPAEAVIALQNGAVQVAVIPDQVGQRFVDDGVLRVIRSLDDDDFETENCCVLGLMGSFIDENTEVAERITRAVYNASRWMNESEENKREAVTVLIQAGYLSAAIDIDYVVGLMSNWIWGVPHDITEQTLITSIDEYQALGVINPALDPDALRLQVWHPLG